MIERLFRVQFQDKRSETIWLTVYADLITNLTLVFLALFGLTMMGDNALRQALISMNLNELTLPDQDKDLSDFEKAAVGIGETFADNPDVSVSQNASSARITFGESVLFESGRANLKDSAQQPLLQVAEALRDLPYTIIVEGHTDSLPLKANSQFKNNWELSLARAMGVVRLLIQDGQIAADKCAAAAYGSYRPVASNFTAFGRRANRRVTVSFLKDFPVNQALKDPFK